MNITAFYAKQKCYNILSQTRSINKIRNFLEFLQGIDTCGYKNIQKLKIRMMQMLCSGIKHPQTCFMAIIIKATIPAHIVPQVAL